ncbi:MAG: hypothetical protein ABGZ53_11505, partial [Fuerstiella sp.]
MSRSQRYQVLLYFNALVIAVTFSLTFIGRLLADEPVESEPAEPRWKYSAKLLRPFWQGDTVEGESVLFMRDPKTGEAKASVLFPVMKVLSVRNSAGDVTYEE